MKKIFILFFALFSVLVFNGLSQTLTQDSKNDSSIKLPGGVVSFDFTKTALTFSINNFDRDITKKKGILWGLSATGANSAGISSLFEAGEVTTGTSLSGTVGYFWASDYTSKYVNPEKYENNLRKLEEKSQKKFHNILSKVVQQLGNKVDIENSIQIMRSSLTLEDFLTSLSVEANQIDKCKFSLLKQEYDKLVNIKKQIEKSKCDENYRRWLLYLDLGYNSNKFKLVNDSNSVGLDDKFEDETFKGGFFKLGANLQLGGSWLFGAAIGYEKANNISSLKKKTFILESSQVYENQKLTEEKEITAYSGDYEEFGQLSFNADSICIFKLSDDFSLAWDILYLRWKMPQGADTVNDMLNIGTSAYFFKREDGKFLGGLYVEVPDITGAKENGEVFLDKLKIGIVAKYSFSSISFPKKQFKKREEEN